MIERVRASDADPALHGQVVRYAITGVGLVLLYSAIYWAAVEPLGIAPLIANTLAFIAALIVGFVIHSRWSFRGHGSRERPAIGHLRFLIVNLAGYALNSFWVWLIAERLGFAPSFALIPIALVTPCASFWANRRWVFA